MEPIYLLAQRVDQQDGEAGAGVEQFFDDLPYLGTLLSILGGALFIYMVAKFIFGRARGGGSGGGQIGQIILGLFGLMLFFNPSFLFSLAEGVMRLFTPLWNMIFGNI